MVRPWWNRWIPPVAILGILFVIWWVIWSVLLGLRPGFDSDEFLHAAPANDIALFLLRGDIASFFQRVQQEVFYPPLHALVLGGVFVLSGGASALIARGFSLALYLSVMLLVGYATYHLNADRTEKEVRWSAVFMTLLMAVTCPVAFYLSSLCMLEPLGMVLCVVVLVIFVSVKRYTIPSSLLLGLFLFSLAISKHTFPLLLFPGIIAATIYGDSREERWFGARERWVLQAFVLCGVLWLLWAMGVERRAIERFLFGHHARGYVVGLSENLYYLKSLYQDFHLFWPLALIAFPLSLLGFTRNLSSFSVRFAGFSLLISLILFGFVSERTPRHVLLLAPLWWFLVGVGWRELLGLLGERAKGVQTFFSLGTILIFCFLLSIRGEVYKRSVHTLEAKPDQDEAIRMVVDSVPQGERFILFGGETFAFPYQFTWLLAIKNHLTIPEAKALWKKGVREKMESYSGSRIVAVRRKKSHGQQIYDELNTSLCKKITCHYEETSSYLLLFTEGIS